MGAHADSQDARHELERLQVELRDARAELTRPATPDEEGPAALQAQLAGLVAQGEALRAAVDEQERALVEKERALATLERSLEEERLQESGLLMRLGRRSDEWGGPAAERRLKNKAALVLLVAVPLLMFLATLVHYVLGL